MGAADSFMPRRSPGWPLALTLGAHVLMAWWWLQAKPSPPEALPVLREFFVLPLLPAPSAPATPAAAAPAQAAQPARVFTPRLAPRPAASAQAAAALAPDAIELAPAPAQADADRLPSPSPAPAAPGEGIAARAIRAAGAIDHGARVGKPATLHSADTPWNRFTNAVEEAHNDTSRTLVTETYIAPDGVIIYRFRQGSRVVCRTSGHVGPNLGNLAEGGGAAMFDRAGGGGKAGLIDCPKQATFKRD